MLRAKTAAFVAFVVVTNVAGNAALNAGVKNSNLLLVAGGVALLIAWTLARMSLLSWADLSWVLPVTAIGYVLTTATGRILFNESVTTERWLGAICVTVGASLVALAEPRAAASGAIRAAKEEAS